MIQLKTESSFRPHKYGHEFAVNLIEQIQDMNEGNYLMDDVNWSQICVLYWSGGKAPGEKHFEAMNLATDLQHLKAKVDAGAEYIVTQMFFDNEKYFKFVDACREIGIKVPIIPGLKPLKTLNHISFLPKFFHIASSGSIV